MTEQYQLIKKQDFENLRFCLDNYKIDGFFIRLMGSSGGTIKVNTYDKTSPYFNLENKVLDFTQNKSEIKFLIDSKEVFNFSFKEYALKYIKGFNLEYMRMEEYEYDGKKEKRPISFGYGEYTYGIDPYDKRFPEPDYSTFRAVWDRNLVEIVFKGRIDIEFDSWWDKDAHWKYWRLIK